MAPFLTAFTKSGPPKRRQEHAHFVGLEPKGKGCEIFPSRPQSKPGLCKPSPTQTEGENPRGTSSFLGGRGTRDMGGGACTWALRGMALQLPGHVLARGATEVSSAVGSALRRTSNPSPDLWPLTRPCPITGDSDAQGKRRRTERKQADLCHPNVHVFKPEFPVPQTGDCI